MKITAFTLTLYHPLRRAWKARCGPKPLQEGKSGTTRAQKSTPPEAYANRTVRMATLTTERPSSSSLTDARPSHSTPRDEQVRPDTTNDACNSIPGAATRNSFEFVLRLKPTALMLATAMARSLFDGAYWRGRARVSLSLIQGIASRMTTLDIFSTCGGV